MNSTATKWERAKTKHANKYALITAGYTVQQTVMPNMYVVFKRDNLYKVIIDKRGSVKCDCVGFGFRGYCKHAAWVEKVHNARVPVA